MVPADNKFGFWLSNKVIITARLDYSHSEHMFNKLIKGLKHVTQLPYYRPQKS